ncbi:hypothetical protein JCM16358_25410 [Halanaerocella petrolearia]
MKVNGLIPIYFDIETEGFSAFEDEFICAAYTNLVTGEEKVISEINQLMEEFMDLRKSIIITYNGENWKGGFDFPWLRSKCLQQDIEWTLGGLKHLDLLPLVKKYINTTSYDIPSKSSLMADDLKKLADANGIDYKNKTQCYTELMKNLDKVDWLDYEMQPNEDNSLQNVYQLLFDSECNEEYTSGAEVPKLYKVIKNTDNELEQEEAMNKIIEHNKRDIKRLKKVAQKAIPVIPNWEIQRNTNQL